MKTPIDDQEENTRRSFLLSTGSLLTTAWLGAQWPAIKAAAHHADAAGHHAQDMASVSAPVGFDFLTAAEAADVDALAAQIVPSGATPGAKEARSVYFIDRALATFFSNQAGDFRKGLADFQAKFHTAYPGATTFAAATPDEQLAYLKTVDHTPFFEGARVLTILGMFTAPKYGGNYQGIGWQAIGFVDQHAFTPPFGYYDREYTGFVPYPGTLEKHS